VTRSAQRPTPTTYSAGELDREPGDDHGDERADDEEGQHDDVRQDEQPLDQGQPPVEVAWHVGVVQIEVNRLGFHCGRVGVGQQRGIGPDTGGEPVELQREVEPPAWVALPEKDHQQCRGEQPADDATAGAAHLRDDLPVVVTTVTVDVAVADRAPRTMAMGMIQMIRNAVVTRSSSWG
jgi:hypothetical protein